MGYVLARYRITIPEEVSDAGMTIKMPGSD